MNLCNFYDWQNPVTASTTNPKGVHGELNSGNAY